MERVLKVNDFFCGCGGMGIAFKNAGYEIAGAWDFDKYAVQTYKENVGDHVKQTDIREMTYKDVPKADVWAFGFPCQDLSVAGKQKGMILKCDGCGEEIEIKPEEYNNQTICPVCGGDNFKAASRSGMFFEMMRLLEETEQNTLENMPAVIIAENVRGLKPYLPVLRLEYERHGYTAHVEMFNSKYWGVPQNRERYAVVGTRDRLNLQFDFPKEQHEFVPKLSDFIEENVDEKYYLPDEKAQTIINQALEKLEAMGKCHACITPDRINKRQNGPRAKAEEEPMFTLTAQDIHGIIIETPRSVKLQNSNMRGRRVKEPEEVTFSLTSGDIDGIIVEGKETEEKESYISKKLQEFVEINGYIPKMFNPYNCSEITNIAPTVTAQCGSLTSSSTVLIIEDEETGTALAEETEFLDPTGYGKAIEQGGATPNSSGQSNRKKCNENNGYFPVPYGERLQRIWKESGKDNGNRAEAGKPTILNVANCNPSRRGMNGNVYFCEGLAPTLTTNKGEGIKIITIEKRKEFDNEK